MARKKLLSLIMAGTMLLGSFGLSAQETFLKQEKRVEQAVKVYKKAAQDEQKVIEQLDIPFAWEFAKKLGQFGTAKNGTGFRMAGTTAAKEAAAYIFETFESFGYEPEYYEFPVIEWTYYDSDLKVKGHDNKKWPVTPFTNTPATPKEGLTGELVYIGNGTKEELENVDLTGKIALIDMDPDKLLWHNNAALQARLHGAEAVIMYYTAYYGVEESGEAEFVGDWSGRRIDIPVLSMPQKYGKQLAEIVQKEKVEVTLFSDVVLNEKGTGRNVLTQIKGSKYPDEYIIIDAHHDAFFTSMQDNSMPVGMMMAIAKAMADVNYQPERTLLFVTTDAEETGDIDTFYDWMIGAWRMLNDKIDEWNGKVVNAHTLEMIGVKGSEELGFRAPDIMYPFAKSVIEGYKPLGVEQEQLDVDNYITTSSDEWAYSYFGIPTTRTRNEHKADEMYHSRLDNLEHADFNVFKDNVILQTKMIMRLDQMVIMPYDLATPAEKYVLALDEEVLKDRGIQSSLVETAKQYIKKADKLYNQSIQIKKLYDAAKQKEKDLSQVEKLLEEYNRAMRKVSQTVIQGTQYVALDQVVTQTAYYQNLPGEYEEAISYLKANDPEGMLEHFDIDNDEMGQYAQSYIEYMEYPVWINAYRECFEPESKGLKFNWTEGILLKYYDIYRPLTSILEKVDQQERDFVYEIEAFVTIRNDVQNRLEKACEEDTKMWLKASKELPLALSEQILTLLKR